MNTMTKNDTTSEFLKDCMAEAVMRLLEQWPLDKIQVKQICDVSGYRRMSWFRAFGSKHEAVSYHIVRLWQQWSERHGVVVRDDFSIDNAESFFEFNYEIRDTLRLLRRRGLLNDLSGAFQSGMVSSRIDEPVRAYYASMFAASLYGILRQWIVRDFDRPPAEMATILRSATACMV